MAITTIVKILRLPARRVNVSRSEEGPCQATNLTGRVFNRYRQTLRVVGFEIDPEANQRVPGRYSARLGTFGR